MGSRASYLHVMTKAVEKAAFSIVRDFGELEKLQSSKSGVARFVESAYKRSEDQLMYVLSKAYPDIPFGDQDKLSWIIDPISGYQNFERSFPYFSISIALVEDKEIVAGVVLDPIRGDCFKAEYGSGAFVNNRNRLRVSSRKDLDSAVIAVYMPYALDSILVKNNAIIKRLGGGALDFAYLASGKFDACIVKDYTFSSVSSGIILVKESGGFVESQKNENGSFDVISASSSEMMKKLLSFYNTI